MKTIRKALIPAAGLGTRFLPATKAMPKEMLPILTKPTIQYIVEEAVAAGIEDIIIVTGKHKRAIEDHFDNAFELEEMLRTQGKLDLLKRVQCSSRMADIHYIRQKEPLGLGHAIWVARKFFGDEPFAVLLGDDIVQAEVPCIRQLIDTYEKVQSPVIAVKHVPDEETNRYGIVKARNEEGPLYQVERLVEKPPLGQAPSNLAIMGRYILTSEIFELLERQERGVGGEIQLTDAIQSLNELRQVYAYAYEGTRYDVGDLGGFIETTLEFAMRDANLRGQAIQTMERLLKQYGITSGK
ncbi:UTP--glucose-1-phosphate uridylyltransferase GalU [Paenibacillus sp. MMS18-CY102]|uniref:UTP--glucose-1-phosphate uridylyltransferase GalU n=1 Tax=Paenibacillus sp. MMS18-CY102 TaxID=2682849 RepID=UPI0013665D5D|nr:UTP--glucose-1-phosphate uridylyltransferase GalU [Paenibacillus sp. MMS18-CY102]MWC27321.1 UTP--glucose-1-phosphate uridylyltransferase GalU [Paenibacillus sp. MMS18-CY102]